MSSTDAWPISVPPKVEYHHEIATTASPPATDPGPPPDGGINAWLQVLAGHLILINTWGYISSFGIFQAYYVSYLNRSASDISWVGSIETFLLFFIGTFSGRATDAGYYRPVLFVGLFLCVLGVFMTSISTTYWQLFLAQGLCQGIGNGLLFCPTIALISTYFAKKRVFALSLVASGAATGGLIFPAIAQSLLNKIGFGWSIRSMGFVMLFNSIVILSIARPRLPPRKTGPFIEWAAFKELPYVLFAMGTFFMLWGVYFAYFYVRLYARDVLGTSSYTSFSMLLILNGVGIPGRIVPAIISDRYLGPINTLIPTAFMAGVLLFIWIAIDSLNSMYAFVVIFGYFGAGVQSLFPAALGSLTSDLAKVGVRIGMVFSIVSFAALSGPPIAGQLIQRRNGNYLDAQIFGGLVLIIASLLLSAARIAKTGMRVKQRM